MKTGLLISTLSAGIALVSAQASGQCFLTAAGAAGIMNGKSANEFVYQHSDFADLFPGQVPWRIYTDLSGLLQAYKVGYPSPAKGTLDVCKLYIIDDNNAYAQPGGVIFLGRPLVESLRHKFGEDAMATCLRYVLAHEAGHELQFIVKMNPPLQMPSTVSEIQADILAGYYMGSSALFDQDEDDPNDPDYSGSQRDNQSHDENIEKALRAVQSLGDFAKDSIFHHGTPDTRWTAVKSGMDVGNALRYGVGLTIDRKALFLWSYKLAVKLAQQD
jgi:hypothetical protein